jgi:hypothetical protein
MKKLLMLFSILICFSDCAKNNFLDRPGNAIAGTWSNWGYTVTETSGASVNTSSGSYPLNKVVFDGFGNFTFTYTTDSLFATINHQELGTYSIINDSQIRITADTAHFLEYTTFFYPASATPPVFPNILKFKKISPDSLIFIQQWVDSISPLSPPTPITPTNYVDINGFKKLP